MAQRFWISTLEISLLGQSAWIVKARLLLAEGNVLDDQLVMEVETQLQTLPATTTEEWTRFFADYLRNRLAAVPPG